MAAEVPPVSDVVVCRWSAWRYVAASAAIGFLGAGIGWPLVSLLASALAGRPNNLVIPSVVV